MTENDIWIDNKEELKSLRDRLGARQDWHEPDEQGLTVEFVYSKYDTEKEGNFDNAFTRGDHESHLVIRKYGKPVAKINIAMLLCWACDVNL